MRAKSTAVFGAVIVLSCLVQPLQAQNTGTITHPSATPGTMPQSNVATAPINSNPPIPGTMQPGVAKPVAYQDQSRGFMLVAPAGARFQEIRKTFTKSLSLMPIRIISMELLMIIDWKI